MAKNSGYFVYTGDEITNHFFNELRALVWTEISFKLPWMWARMASRSWPHSVAPPTKKKRLSCNCCCSSSSSHFVLSLSPKGFKRGNFLPEVQEMVLGIYS